MGTEMGDNNGGQRATEPVRVLYVDGDDAGRSELTSYARDRRRDVTVTAVADTATALQHVDDAVDCIVSEYDLPDGDGLTLYEDVHDGGFDGLFVSLPATAPRRWLVRRSSGASTTSSRSKVSRASTSSSIR